MEDLVNLFAGNIFSTASSVRYVSVEIFLILKSLVVKH